MLDDSMSGPPSQPLSTVSLESQQPTGGPPKHEDAASPAEAARLHEEDVNKQEDVDDEENLDEDGFPISEEPCEKIRDELEGLLGGDLAFKGSFAFSRTYHAPLPALSLSDLGTVGSPLSTREAELVKTRCIQAPFGKGERTVVDREVRDTWEMDAPLVVFCNPEWGPWLQGVVREICTELGVNTAASQPRAELYKLLLYETGSHFLPHVDTEKANGMFATVVVVLPSEFTGGDAHLSHGGQSKIFNSSGPSLTKTTVLAWYTDVMHEIKPITSGYRLALAYNLIHTTTSLRPALTAVNATVTRLRHVLLSWKQNPDWAPDKIIYLLDHKYSQANLSGSALKSRDAHVFAILDSLAKEVGFCLGLANVEHHQKGYAEDNGHHGRRGWYGDSDDEDEDDVGFAEVEEETTSVENLVNVDGKTIQEDPIDFDDELETIPELAGYFEGEEYDDQEYEGYQGNGAGSLERFYRRTALVLWPKWGTLGGGGGADRRSAYALDELKASTSTEPTTRDLDLYDYLSISAQYLTKRAVLDVLCGVARRWKKRDYWIDTVRSCMGGYSGDLLSIDEVAAASAIFGFSSLKYAIKDVLLRDPSNTSRFRYLQQLSGWANLLPDHHVGQEVDNFVGEMRLYLLEHIELPTENDVELLINEAQTISVIQNTLLPQLRRLGGATVLDAFAVHLHTITPTIAATSEDQAAVKTILGELVSGQVDKMDFFRGVSVTQPKAHPYYSSYHPKPPSGSPDIALDFIRKCMSYENAGAATVALNQMLDFGVLPAPEIEARIEQVLLPLTHLICADPGVRMGIPDDLVLKLGHTVVLRMMDTPQTKKGQIKGKELGIVLDVSAQTGNAEMITSTIVPKLWALPWHEHDCKEVIEELHRRRVALNGTSAALADLYKTAVDKMMKVYLENVALSQQNYGGLLDFCLKIGGIESMRIVVQRILTAYSSSRKSVADHLVPLMKDLLLVAKNATLSPASEPFASALKQIVTAWTSNVLGPRPSMTAVADLRAKLSRYTCSCPECQRVKSFLQGEDASIRLDRIYATKRKHVEKELDAYVRGLVTYSTINSTPQGLQVSKSAAVHSATSWMAKQKQGRELMKTIGSEALQRQIFGDAYQVIANILDGGGAPAMAKTTAGMSATASSSRVIPSSAPAMASGSRPAPGGSLMAATRAVQSRAPAPVATASTSAPSTAAIAAVTQYLATLGTRFPAHVQPPAAAAVPAHPQAAPVRPPGHSNPPGRVNVPVTPSKRKTNDTIDLTTPSPEPKRSR